MNNQQIKKDDEIDLKDLFSTLWRGKIYIILLTFASVFLASLYLHSTVRKYTVMYNLKPVGDTNKSPDISGVGGLASIAGIQLPSSSNDDFNIFKELITSVEVSEIIFKNKNLTIDAFSNEWSDSLKKFSRPQKSKAQTFVSNAKKLLTGNKEANYMPPNPRRLSIFIAKNIEISEEKQTGFLKITSETPKPELMISLIIEAAKASNEIMRQRYIDFSADPLAFYKEKIRTARSREHRAALAELIAEEEQKLMFASRGKYFIAEPYINPTISLYPTTPKPKIILAFSLVMGFLLGAALALTRNMIKKEN
jgi:hypothetical protein